MKYKKNTYKKLLLIILVNSLIFSHYFIGQVLAEQASDTYIKKYTRIDSNDLLSPQSNIEKLRAGSFFEKSLTSEFTGSRLSNKKPRKLADLKLANKNLFPIPFPFPSAQFDRGQSTPEWLESYIMSRVLLELSFKHNNLIPLKAALEIAPEVFENYGLKANIKKIIKLINGLQKRALISNADGLDFSYNHQQIIQINVPLRTLAVWSDAFNFIRSDIKNALASSHYDFLTIIEEYALTSELWPAHPIESRYPVLRAIASLTAEEQKKLIAILLNNERLRTYPLIDSTILMLDFEEGKKEWLQKYAPQLVNRNLYLIAAEISLLAGGLGRVMQYHGTNMHKLGANVLYVEPYYPLTRDKTGSVQPLDYSGLAIPVKDLKKIDYDFTTIVQNGNISFEVFVGKNTLGITVYLIRDKKSEYVNILYEYGTQESPASNYEFTEFFTKATLELIKYLEVKERKKLGNRYKPPLVDANDGQALPLNAFRRIFYLDKEKIITEGTNKRDIDLAHEVLTQAIFNGTTHTYRNRGIINDFNYGRHFLSNAGIPEEYLWLFLRKEIDGTLLWDMTSGGLRSSDTSKAVSAIHAHEMNALDPMIKLIGITNGDDRVYSSAYFREALKILGVSDFEHPTAQQVAKAKAICKKNIGLDPNQMVISYSGRLVQEKAGRNRALTDENIEALVKEGIQVLIYGNVQPYEESIAIKESLERLQERLSNSGYKGRLIFKPKFNIDEQRQLLAATDIQIQDSDRYTGAAEYTEADVTANGGIQMGAPFWEGIIQKQGAVINSKTMTGNTLVPADTNSSSFLNSFNWAHKKFLAPNNELSVYQASSIELSRVLEASLTAAEYLRFWNNAFWEQKNKMPAPKPRVAGEVNILDLSLICHSNSKSASILRQVNNFSLDYSPQKGDELEFTVTIDRQAFDSLHYGQKHLVSFDLVSAQLVNDYGLRVPLSIKKVAEITVTFNAFLPKNLPLPFNGIIEITSGLWKSARSISITTNTIVKRKSPMVNSTSQVSTSI